VDALRFDTHALNGDRQSAKTSATGAPKDNRDPRDSNQNDHEQDPVCREELQDRDVSHVAHLTDLSPV